jgi:LuxR family transcriptional regulator, maltose regulon positive regulatory protein
MTKSKRVPLINTKTSKPLVRADIVPRPRLIEQLNKGLDHPLTLVCAGAGFGKTTLISAWMDELAAQEKTAPEPAPLTAWLSLDEQDNIPNHFLRYFIAAVRTAVPTACRDTLGLLQAQLEPDPALLLATLSNDLLLLPRNIVVALDDYHTIQGTAVHDLLNELLQHWPQPLHLVLVTRYSPPLSIARLRARGAITEIRNHDLRFTPEEVAEYVRRIWSLPLSQPGLEMLEQKTEGWIVGMQLASLSLRTAENVEAVLESLTGSNADIAEYMAEEILLRQPPAFQTFLLKTAILDRFSAPLCEAIAANEDPAWDARAMLDWLVYGNLFIVSLDNHGQWYRFHSLFRDWLRQRLKEKVGQEGIASLHRQAAHWFAQNDLLDLALHHALQAEDLNLAAAFMEQDLPNVLNHEDWLTLKRWLRLLPEEFIDSRPGLLMIKAWVYNFAWQITAVNKVLRKLEALLDQNKDAAPPPVYQSILRGQIASLQTQQAFNRGQSASGITCGREALTLLPESWSYARGGAMIFLGLNMQAAGQQTAAIEMLLAKYEPLRDKTDVYALRLLFTLCLIYLQAGQLEQVEQTAKLLLQQAVQNELNVMQGWGHFLLGLVHYQWNHLDLAGQHFGEIVAKHYRMHALTARHGIIGAALVHLAAGRLAEAWRLVELLSQIIMEQNGRLDETTQSLQAQLLLAVGDEAEAQHWADAFTTPVAPVLLALLELPQLSRAQILLAIGGADNVAHTWPKPYKYWTICIELPGKITIHAARSRFWPPGR